MAALEARSVAILAFGIAIVHLLSWSLVLTYMNDSSLFGKRQFQFNRYYSTKTVHVHKAKDLRITSAPSHWESLGLTRTTKCKSMLSINTTWQTLSLRVALN